MREVVVPAVVIYVIFCITLIILVWKFLGWIGKRRDSIRFDEDFAMLEFYVKNSLEVKPSVIFIMAKFNEIEENPAKDPEKLRKLRKEFETRFAIFIDGDLSDY